jgi:hypothetical protein
MTIVKELGFHQQEREFNLTRLGFWHLNSQTRILSQDAVLHLLPVAEQQQGISYLEILWSKSYHLGMGWYVSENGVYHA